MSYSSTTELTSTRSPRVNAAKRLVKRAFRDRDGRFLAEGPQACREAAALPGVLLELYVTAEAADRLDTLVANLLDLSRLQTGAVRPVLAPTSLDEVLHRALQSVPSGAVEDATHEDLPLVLTDAGLLERVVANIVENAVRHSPDGVPVRLAAHVADGRLQLLVVDRGPGVPERDRPRMFQAFQRLGDSPAGSGVGLGLAVATGLADAVGATVDAEDTPGGGLTMVVSVPLAEASP